MEHIKGEWELFIEEYQIKSIRTMKFDESVITHCCMGLSGETGEVIDIIKKLWWSKIFYVIY